MAKVVPTVLAATPAEYAERIDRLKPFATRLHVDVSDGVFADGRTVGLTQVYDLDGAELDLHLMLAHPEGQLENIVSLQPELVTFHYETDIDHEALIRELASFEIKVGLALLPETTVAEAARLVPHVDHVLVFTGKLGHNGGTFQSACLDKVAELRALKPELEIGVDGGINQETARLCVAAGVDVLYVGSFIHDHDDPETAYVALEAIAGEAV